MTGIEREKATTIRVREISALILRSQGVYTDAESVTFSELDRDDKQFISKTKIKIKS